MRKQWKWYIYILLCKDDSYYTGKTWKAELRYDQHKSGLGGSYTKDMALKNLYVLKNILVLQ